MQLIRREGESVAGKTQQRSVAVFAFGVELVIHGGRSDLAALPGVGVVTNRVLARCSNSYGPDTTPFSLFTELASFLPDNANGDRPGRTGFPNGSQFNACWYLVTSPVSLQSEEWELKYVT